MTVSTSYCTADDLKWELGSYEMTDDGSDDSKFELAISAASRQVDNYCNQRFWMDDAVVTRTFETTMRDRLYLTDGIATTVGLVIALDVNDAGTYGTTLTSGTDYILRPTNAAQMVPAEPYDEIRLVGSAYQFQRSSYGRELLQVTAKWGWPAVPDEVKKATLVQAADLFKAKDATFGVVGSNDFGTVRITSGLNRTAEALLERFHRINVA